MFNVSAKDVTSSFHQSKVSRPVVLLDKLDLGTMSRSSSSKQGMDQICNRAWKTVPSRMNPVVMLEELPSKATQRLGLANAEKVSEPPKPSRAVTLPVNSSSEVTSSTSPTNNNERIEEVTSELTDSPLSCVQEDISPSSQHFSTEQSANQVAEKQQSPQAIQCTDLQQASSSRQESGTEKALTLSTHRCVEEIRTPACVVSAKSLKRAFKQQKDVIVKRLSKPKPACKKKIKNKKSMPAKFAARNTQAVGLETVGQAPIPPTASHMQTLEENTCEENEQVPTESSASENEQLPSDKLAVQNEQQMDFSVVETEQQPTGPPAIVNQPLLSNSTVDSEELPTENAVESLQISAASEVKAAKQIVNSPRKSPLAKRVRPNFPDDNSQGGICKIAVPMSSTESSLSHFFTYSDFFLGKRARQQVDRYSSQPKKEPVRKKVKKVQPSPKSPRGKPRKKIPKSSQKRTPKKQSNRSIPVSLSDTLSLARLVSPSMTTTQLLSGSDFAHNTEDGAPMATIVPRGTRVTLQLPPFGVRMVITLQAETTLLGNVTGRLPDPWLVDATAQTETHQQGDNVVDSQTFDCHPPLSATPSIEPTHIAPNKSISTGSQTDRDDDVGSSSKAVCEDKEVEADLLPGEKLISSAPSIHVSSNEPCASTAVAAGNHSYEEAEKEEEIVTSDHSSSNLELIYSTGSDSSCSDIYLTDDAGQCITEYSQRSPTPKNREEQLSLKTSKHGANTMNQEQVVNSTSFVRPCAGPSLIDPTGTELSIPTSHHSKSLIFEHVIRNAVNRLGQNQACGNMVQNQTCPNVVPIVVNKPMNKEILENRVQCAADERRFTDTVQTFPASRIGTVGVFYPNIASNGGEGRPQYPVLVSERNSKEPAQCVAATDCLRQAVTCSDNELQNVDEMIRPVETDELRGEMHSESITPQPDSFPGGTNARIREDVAFCPVVTRPFELNISVVPCSDGGLYESVAQSPVIDSQLKSPLFEDVSDYSEDDDVDQGKHGNSCCQ